jgi:hypothetical protein
LSIPVSSTKSSRSLAGRATTLCLRTAGPNILLAQYHVYISVLSNHFTHPSKNIYNFLSNTDKMGCCGNRKKQTHEFTDQKWEYINLKDFKAKGCGSPFAYGYLWFSLILSIAVYAVDSFTAVNLIFFDRWSSQIQPAIGFTASRWIFAVCIILSFVNLGFEGIRAFRVMRRGNVAECYLDSLAVRWESIRLGEGQGWRRFLVFADLTDSKKGAEYIAIFTYFSFKCLSRCSPLSRAAFR